MMNQARNMSSSLVDVSSFMLFESTGDSEFDSSNNISSTTTTTSLDPILDSLITRKRFLEDDDAQSCSYECSFSSEHSVRVDVEKKLDLDFRVKNEDNDDDDGDADSSSCSRVVNGNNVDWNSNIRDDDNGRDEDEDDEEGDVVEQRWIGVNRCKKAKATNVRVDSSVMEELKSQKDKDRLFWETCLAS